jgi:pyrimidine 5'-nucleotidase
MRYTTIFFDLDDTLYPSSTGLWDLIRWRMNKYMEDLLQLPADEISNIRQMYLDRYGTTLRGLQIHHQVDVDDYLAYVHDLPLADYIQPNPTLRELLLSLPQNRWIFTNADANHARRVIDILGLEGCFHGIIDIRALDFVCKPDPQAYHIALRLAGEVDPDRCVLIDDAPRNLVPAQFQGYRTVLVGTNGSNPGADFTIRFLADLPKVLPELWGAGWAIPNTLGG